MREQEGARERERERVKVLDRVGKKRQLKRMKMLK